MKQSDLMVIYGHENLLFNVGEGRDQLAYYIHYFYNGQGILNDRDFIQFLFDSVLSDEQKEVYAGTMFFGPFHVFAELEDFSLRAASFLKKDSLSLLSLGEYNEIAVTAKDYETLFADLREKGHSIARSEEPGKKNFFSNLFKPS